MDLKSWQGHEISKMITRKRSRKFYRGLMGKLALLLTVTVSVGAVVPVYATSVEEKEQNISDLEDQKEDLEEYIESLEALKADTEAYIAEIDSKMADYTEQLVALQTSLAEVETQIADTEEQLAEAEEDIEDQYAAMKLRIKYMYENGNTQILELLLESTTLTDFLNKAEYITQISEYDRNMLVKMQETKQLIEDSKAALEAQQAELETLKAEVEEKQDDLEILLAAKQEEVENYNTTIASTENEIDEVSDAIAAEEAALQKQIEEIESSRKAAEEASSKAAAEASSKAAAEAASKAAAEAAAAAATTTTGSSSGDTTTTTTTTTTSSTGYIWPLSGYHYITSEFGYRTHPVTGEAYSYHQGIDIYAPTGTSIMAVASGTVAWASYSSTAGYWIGIDHGGGVYSVYMHCSKLYVSAGQTVSQGEVIALVGATGRVTGPHLHFAIRLNGSYVNPHPYVGY
ncbi:MAG: peptidoglycan DD-metalloendopeptidase family protein [Lachnospiraceae bacterium]|nr:peptidoglycan DD-metalloendopeptidase family protein [Lachnospiraceae bacterium]